MSSYSLDDIRAAADAKYSSTDINFGDGTAVKLVNVLRLPKAKRDALTDLQKEMNAEGSDQGELMRRAIGLVSDNDAMSQKLFGLVGDDLATLAEIFERYSKSTQVGEASASAA